MEPPGLVFFHHLTIALESPKPGSPVCTRVTRVTRVNTPPRWAEHRVVLRHLRGTEPWGLLGATWGIYPVWRPCPGVAVALSG